MGISKVITLSNPEVSGQVNNPRHLAAYKNKLRILQRKLSRQVNPEVSGNNRNKTKKLIPKYRESTS